MDCEPKKERAGMDYREDGDWDGDWIVTLDGRPIGFPLNAEEADFVRHWLNNALPDLDVRAKASGPIVEEITTLAELIDAILDRRLTGLRAALKDSLNITGPVWHRFKSPVRVNGIDAGPGDPVVIAAVGRKVSLHREGYTPTWLPGSPSTWVRAGDVVLHPTVAARVRFSLRSSAARSVSAVPP